MLITAFGRSVFYQPRLCHRPHSDRHVRIYFGADYAPFSRDTRAQAISCPYCDERKVESEILTPVSRFVKYSS